MPTGYTAAVEDGTITELRPFALRCARAFGALIQMRDDRLDAPIPEKLKADTGYHDKGISTAQKVLDTLPLLSVGQCQEMADEEHRKARREHEKHQRNRDEARARYAHMTAQIEAWTPDPLVANLKQFMLDQITESMRFGFGDGYPAPRAVGGTAWRDAKLKVARRDLAYHREQRAEEIARTDERNEWLDALRASLPAE